MGVPSGNNTCEMRFQHAECVTSSWGYTERSAAAAIGFSRLAGSAFHDGPCCRGNIKTLSLGNIDALEENQWKFQYCETPLPRISRQTQFCLQHILSVGSGWRRMWYYFCCIHSSWETRNGPFACNWLRDKFYPDSLDLASDTHVRSMCFSKPHAHEVVYMVIVTPWPAPGLLTELAIGPVEWVGPHIPMHIFIWS